MITKQRDSLGLCFQLLATFLVLVSVVCMWSGCAKRNSKEVEEGSITKAPMTFVGYGLILSDKTAAEVQTEDERIEAAYAVLQRIIKKLSGITDEAGAKRQVNRYRYLFTQLVELEAKKFERGANVLKSQMAREMLWDYQRLSDVFARERIRLQKLLPPSTYEELMHVEGVSAEKGP